MLSYNYEEGLMIIRTDGFLRYCICTIILSKYLNMSSRFLNLKLINFKLPLRRYQQQLSCLITSKVFEHYCTE